ncbi:MAG: hypothetical protein IPG86_15860 [Chitinophagaceae bacterium]|nr:hypothetical protein [Chitinophagaceae bacterium]
MKKESKILTLHPEGKKGVNISLTRYEQIKKFIIDTVRTKKEISFGALADLAVSKLTGKFDGKVTWYIVTVKLDLEARRMIERIPGTSPHQLRIPAKKPTDPKK